MQDVITQRAVHCKQQLALAEQALAQTQQRGQELMQEILRLQGALRELEAIVVARPVASAGTRVVPEGA